MIVDDHPMVREGIAMRINREPDMATCCEATDGEQAISICLEQQPDIVLLDLNLRDTTGLAVIRQLHSKCPSVKVLVFSMLDENIYAERVLQAGAQGYIMKQAASETLILAVRQVLEGHLYVSDSLRTHLVRNMMANQAQKAGVASLSNTEFEVLSMLGMQLSNRQISERLNRSTKTIESHCASIKKKLGLENGRALVQFAVDWARSANLVKPIQ